MSYGGWFRGGKHPAWRFVAAAYAGAVLGGLALDLVALPYIDPSPAEFAGGVGVTQTGMALASAIALGAGCLRSARSTGGWLGDGGTSPRRCGGSSSSSR